MTYDARALRESAEAARQGHIFAFWDDLDTAGRERLLAQVARIDFRQVAALGELLRKPPEMPRGELAPPQMFPLERGAHEERRAREAREVGADMLARGSVGYVLVAGGQASRLGYDGPKGCFPVGPLSNISLFEMHARRLLAAARRHGAPAVWYVMTSEANDAATREFFARHDHFGLAPGDVHFFAQDMLPALDEQGRILLAAKDALFLAPNGHGGVLGGLATSGLLADARRRGIETLSYFQVDNPLVRPADALFLGLHRLARAEMSSKVVEKRDPAEKVGILARVGGAMACIEYSDLPDDLRNAREPDGKLGYRAGNIAVHAIEVSFVEELTRGGLRLPYHLATKRMKALDESGREVERTGTKFETFVFDALGRTTSSVVMEVDRAMEFSPVKNATGQDSPATARRDLCAVFASMVERAGRPLPKTAADGTIPVEVDPLLAEDAEELAARGNVEPRVVAGGHWYAAIAPVRSR